MRPSFNPQVFLDVDGKIICINLGSDFTAEHEMGIKRLENYFGIDRQLDDGIVGVERRRIRNGQVNLLEQEDLCILYCLPFSYDAKNDIEYVNNILERYFKKDDFYCAWDESSFGISSDKPVGIDHLRDLAKAFEEKDIAIWLGSGSPFKNSGLCFGIISRLPQEILSDFEKLDLNRIKLKKAVDKIEQETNLTFKLKSAGKKWFALKPSLNKVHSTMSTKYNVVYWLNPCDQKNNRYGWVTVEELLDWCEDKGPIPCLNNNKNYASSVNEAR